MAGPGPIMHEIHRLRRYISELIEKIDGGPRRVKAQLNRINQQEENLKKTQENHKKTKVSIQEKELNVKTTEQEILKFQKQMGSITNKREYDALRVEIASAKERIAKIEEEILILMEESEEKAKLIPEAEKQVKKAKEECGQFEKDQKEQAERWGQEKKRSQEELQNVEAQLSEDLFALYHRLITMQGEDGISGVEKGRICASCYTEVTAQMANELLREQCVLCKNCGRLLFLDPVEK